MPFGEFRFVARGAGVSVILQGAGLALGYAVHVLLARWMGTTSYGVYSYVLAWVGLLATGAGLGFPVLLVRFIPEYRERNRWSSLRGLLRWTGARTLAAGGSVAVAGSLLVLAVDPRCTGVYTIPLLIGLWLVPLQALLGAVSGAFKGLRRMAPAYAGPVLRYALLLAVGAALVVLSPPLTSRGALAATLAVALVALVVLGSLLRLRLPTAIRHPMAEYDSHTWCRVALPLLLAGGFSLLLSQADVIMVGSLLGPREAGLYRAASKTAGLVGIVLTAVGAAAAPMVATLHLRGDRQALQRLMSSAVRWVFWPALLLTVFFAAAPQFVLRLFGAAFEDASPLLRLLAAGQLINAGTGIAGASLSVIGLQDRVAWIIGGSAVLNLLLNAAGILLFGMVGAALATALVLALSNVELSRQMRREIQIHSSIFYLFKRRTA